MISLEGIQNIMFSFDVFIDMEENKSSKIGKLAKMMKS
jgi:hypothetical protein